MKPSTALALLILSAFAAVMAYGGLKVNDSNNAKLTPGGIYGHGTIIYDVDGDTSHINIAGKNVDVRWLEMNSPEIHHPGLPVQCGGPAAAQWVKSELPPGTKVTIKPDPKLDQIDKYGRTLAYIYRGHKLMNLLEVKLGYAKAYHFEGHRGIHATAIDRAQASAKAAKRGNWGPPCNGNTTQPQP